jgi:serine protease Do
MANMRSIRRAVRHGLVTLAFVLPLYGPSGRAADLVANRSELIQSLLPTVVYISVRKDVAPPTRSHGADASTSSDEIKSYIGSGFVIDPSGLIVTNYHVVEDAFEITVTLSDGTTLPGTLLRASRLADLAVVKVKADGPLTPVQWGDSTKLNVGDQVFAIGNPLGIGVSVSAGIVSGLNRDVQDSPYNHYIQTDAAINHGNSGGPLFDMKGRVVGVDTALVSPTDSSAGLGLAIPSDAAEFVIGRLMQYGWVRPGWIGVKIQQVTPEMARAIGVQRPQGSIVSWVTPGGPAEHAGIAIRDVVLKYGDDIPHDERALLRDIVKTPVGDTVNVVIQRDNHELALPVTVAEWPRSKWDERDAPLPAQHPNSRIAPDLGLSLAAIPVSKRASLGVASTAGGVLVAEVAPGSDAALRGMTNGDIILRVNRNATASPDDVWKAINAEREERREFTLMLVLRKHPREPGAEWIVLRLQEPAG